MTYEQLVLAHKTISYNAFFQILLDSLDLKKSLSVVRCADGEKIFLDDYIQNGDGLLTPNEIMDENWLKRYGVYGITRKELYRRITKAGNECTYFTPSISGLSNKDYDLWDMFDERDYYADNFFVNDFKWEMKESLFKKAGHVLFIHGNLNTADSMQLRVQANLNVKVSYVKLTNWTEAESVIEQASKIDAPLVLFSAGPASKYISNEIAVGGNIVININEI